MSGRGLSGIVGPLLEWYAGHARVLPWRNDPTPYRVWVSEIMLQQTRVEAVIPFFERFVAELPDVASLAAAGEERLMKLWEGLGYYSRARNLHKAAAVVMKEYGGVLPKEPEALLLLPGIGGYTAGAIASIAYGVAAPAVDGNVLRVISRVTGSREDIAAPAVKREIEACLKRVYPEGRAGDFTQALMELGALVCLPNGAPRCGECPLSGPCAAYRQGVQAELPVKKAKKERRVQRRTVFLILCGEKAALRKRPEKGLLAGLWELPSAEGALSERAAREWLAEQGAAPQPLERLPDARHVFTHIEWHMTGYLARVPEPFGGYVWAGKEELRGVYTLPSAFRAFLKIYGERTGNGPESACGK